MKLPVRSMRDLAIASLSIAALGPLAGRVVAQTPTVTDPDLAVRTVITGLDQPIAIAFLGRNDFLVTEKASGKVKRVVNGAVTATVLDLPVNSASERGLLGIALHPDFRRNGWVYLYWTESSTGTDTRTFSQVGNENSPFAPGTRPPLGNRVDRFKWNRGTQKLEFDRNIVTLRAYQRDEGQPLRGNHDGGLRAPGDDVPGEGCGVHSSISSMIRRMCLRSSRERLRSFARCRSSPEAAPSKTRSTKSRTMAPTTCCRGRVGR